MANFIIKGDCDEVTAQLKAKLEADDAQFNAQLTAMFKPAPAPKQDPASAAPAGPSDSTSGWGNATSRKPPNGGSMRSRLRT